MATAGGHEPHKLEQLHAPERSAFDLDALIGDLQGEAARRRADPAFPLDEEAHLGIELDAQAPQPLAPKLERLARAATRLRADRPAPPAGVVRRVVHRAAAAQVEPVAREVVSLGDIVSRALRSVSARLDDLDGRLRRWEHPGGVAPPTGMGAPVRVGAPAGLAAPGANTWRVAWNGRLHEDLPVPPGRVLYIGADAEAAVVALRTVGIDAYGVNPEADRYQIHPDVRQGEPLEHLRQVAGQALGAVVWAGPARVADRAALDELSRELARVTGTAVVLSEAPWWWRAQVGPEAADLSRDRPLSAETWMAGLHRAGFVVTATYAPAGSSYRVVACLTR